MAKAWRWALLLGTMMAGAASAATCYSDGDVVTLDGRAAKQATHEENNSGQSAWVLSLASPICILSTVSGQAARQQSSVSAVQIIDAVPPENARVQLTGKLVTGNVSTYYAVPTALWVLKQRVLSEQ